MLINLGSSGGMGIEITADGTTYRYNGTEISNAYFKISPDGTTGWKLWIYSSVSIKFNYRVNVDICAVGKGGSGAGAGGSFEYGYYAGGGGGAGGMVTSLNTAVTIGAAYAVEITDSSTSIADLGISASRGGHASGRSGGSSGGGGTGSGGGGRYINDHTYPATNIPPSDGDAGKYAFNDSTFDGVRYGHGGCGGDRTPESRGTIHPERGSGGAGGCSGVGPTGGIDGIVCMRNAA